MKDSCISIHQNHRYLANVWFVNEPLVVIDYAGPMFIKNIYRSDNHLYKSWIPRNGSTAAAASKMERFVIANGFQPLTIITKRSILDVAAALDRF